MLSELGRKELPQGKCLVIGGGCSDGESSLHVRKDHPTVIIRDLHANHEEAARSQQGQTSSEALHLQSKCNPLKELES